MAQAEEVILLADSSKTGKVSFAHAGQLEDLDVLITDKGVSAAFTKDCRKKNIKVIQA